MADTQNAPSVPQGRIAPSESIEAAHSAILGLLDSDEETPESKEEQPSEEEESTEETQDESLEEVSEDDEDSEDDESEEEEESEETDEEDSEELYSVRIDGKEHEVTFDELLKGYSRQSDYTRKTQEVSEERRDIESLKNQIGEEIAATQANRQQYMEALAVLSRQTMSGLQQYERLDWESLKEDDPIAYVTRREEYRDAQEAIRQQHAQYEQAKEQNDAETQQAFHQQVISEREKLIEKVPDWGDPEKAKQMTAEIRSYAENNGFTSDELNSLSDHRSLMVLLKAAKYDELQNTNIKAKKLKNKPKVVRAGTGSTKKDSTKAKRNAQMKRLAETGHVDDSVSLFEDFVEL